MYGNVQNGSPVCGMVQFTQVIMTVLQHVP